MKRMLSVVVLLLCALPFPAGAQALTGTITGAVLDASGAAVPGAQVTVRNTGTGLERSTTSNELGVYVLTLLPVGEYEVVGKASGFAETKTGPVRVGVGQQVTFDLKLAVGAVTQAVNVEARAAAIETTRTSVATTVSTTQMGNLGVNGRDFLNFMLLTPGVTQDRRTGDLSFAGQRGTLNNLQVDGTDNNNGFFGQALGRTGTGRAPYQFSVDTVEEFQVNTSSYGAEFGRAGGAVMNVVTKSGTNDFHGSGFWFFRDKAMNANTFFNNANNRARQPFHVNQFGATLGGPVVKNKDFFFFNYDGQRRTNPNPVFLGVSIPAAGTLTAAAEANRAAATQKLNSLLTPYVLTFNQNVFLGKNDWQINDRHRLSVRYNRQNFNGAGLESNGNQNAMEHSGTSKVTTDTLSASFSSVLSPSWLNEARFQYVRDLEPGQQNSLGAETILRQGGSTVLSFGSLNFTPRFTNIHGWQVIENATHTTGRHTLKGGLDVHFASIENFFPGNIRGSYTFNSYDEFFRNAPSQYLQAFAGDGTPGFLTKPNFTDIGVFFQDEFRMSSRLTLNFGVRYDVTLMTKPPVKNPDAQLAAFGVDTTTLRNDANNFGPRFGFAYRPLNSNKLVIRGGYGFYYGRSPQILTSTAYNQNGGSVSTLTFTGAAMPAYPNSFATRPTGGTAGRPNLFVFDKKFVLPLIFQGSLGFEYEVLPNTTVGISYLNVRGEHLARTRDINLFPAQPVSVDLPGIGTRTLLRFLGTQNARPRPVSTMERISLFESGADSHYNGMALSFKRRFATRYQVTLSYTWSKALDTVPDYTSVVVPTDDGKNAQTTLQPNIDRGPANADQRHRVVTNVVWDLDYYKGGNKAVKWLIGGFTVSGIVLAQTGQPFSNTVGGDPNNDGNSASDRVPGDGRNTNYAPTISNWDLRVGKAFPIYERVKLQLGVDLFNAFNQANFIANNIRSGKYSATVASPDRMTFTPVTGANAFGTRSGQTLDNRVLQVSAKITF